MFMSSTIDIFIILKYRTVPFPEVENRNTSKIEKSDHKFQVAEEYFRRQYTRESFFERLHIQMQLRIQMLRIYNIKDVNMAVNRCAKL